MQDLYVLGGAQRATFRDAQEEWLLYERALIARISPGAATGTICCSYETPSEARPSARSSVVFKSGAIAGDRLYVCTSTEVLVFRLPDFRRLTYISVPWFNDLHHVCPTPEGRLAVAVTGLDMVAELTWGGDLVRCWSAVGGDPWRRFSPTTDYRRVATLKPYRAHVNFVFWAQGALWASRGDLGDAVCLDDPGRRIVLGTRACIHDGWVRDGRLAPCALEGLVRSLYRHGLQGIEAYWSKHTPELVRQCERLAARYCLLATGGSDFHGANKPGIELGITAGAYPLAASVMDALTSATSCFAML